ncbi:hypothetical protein ACFX2A_006719 [Malus domestica]
MKLQKSKRRLLRNRRGVCFLKSLAAQRPRGSISEIEEAFAFSKAGLLKDHEGRSQKSKRRLVSQKLGCSKTTKADLRNRRGLLSQKLGCSETTRADLKNRRGTYFSSLVSTCHTHTQLCGNYGHSVEDFWRSRKHMNRTVQSPTFHTQQSLMGTTDNFAKVL